MEYRKGEELKGWFRSERFYRAGGDWYFTSREMCEQGPFPSREDAEGELLLFMRECSTQSHPDKSRNQQS